MHGSMIVGPCFTGGSTVYPKFENKIKLNILFCFFHNFPEQ